MSEEQIARVLPGRRIAAGLIDAVNAAPVELDGATRPIGPFAMVAHVRRFVVEPGALPIDFDVRPHPHIGLAAISYVLDGHVTHRDSLGSRAELGPGWVGSMVAGRGVVHSERFERLRVLGGGFEMVQILLALPDGAEDAEPSFAAVPPERVPRREADGARVVALADPDPAVGAPVRFPAPLLLHDVALAPGARYRPPALADRALYVRDGAIEVGGVRAVAGELALLGPGEAAAVAPDGARLLAFGGAPVGPRLLWWNFLHSSLERIEAARAAWRAGTTPRPPGDTESFTPAPPDDGRPLVELRPR